MDHERGAHAVPHGAVTEQSWQPIETAPKGEHVLLYDPSWEGDVPNIYIGGWTGSCWCVCHEADMDVIEPTHWMPLPSPPRKDSAVTAQVEDTNANLS